MRFSYSSSKSAHIPDTPVAFPNQTGTYYDLKSIQERHKEILRRLVLGQSKGAIARDLGITVAMVRYTERSILCMDYIGNIRDGRETSTMSIHEQIVEIAPDALDVIRKTIAGKMEMDIVDKDGRDKTVMVPIPPKLRVDAAKDILSRAGYVPPVKVSGEITHTHNVQDIIDRAKSMVQQQRIAAQGGNAMNDSVTAIDITVEDTPEKYKGDNT